MKRAALYLRQSLDRSGEGLAVERQRADCQKYATGRHWSVTAEYVDNDVSASSRKPRPAFEQMLSDAKEGRFDVIVCWAVDRLTRKPAEVERLIDLAEQNKVTVATVSGDLDLSTDAGRLVGRILASVARGEVERKSARQVLQQRQRAERGDPPNMRCFGYRTNGEVVEAEAKFVRQMFARLLAGDSISSITGWLKSSTDPAATVNKWSRFTVRKMLMNPRYAAISTYRGEEVGPGRWTPIVDESTFRAAFALLSDERRILNRHGTARKYLGTTLYLCDVCGASIRSAGASSKSSYVCPTGHVARNRQMVDELVVAVVTERLQRPDVSDLLPNDETKRADELRREAGALRLRIEQAADDYAAGLLDARQVHRASERMRAKLATMESELASIGRANGLGEVLAAADPAEAFLQAPLGIQRNVVDALMTVRLGKGVGKIFHTETIYFDWKGE